MLGERWDQRGLWEADRLYLDHVGRESFYGMLASLRGRLFRDAEFAEFHCPRQRPGQCSAQVSMAGTKRTTGAAECWPNVSPPLTVSRQLRRLSSYPPSPYDLRAAGVFSIGCYCKLVARDTVARNFRPLANPFHQEPWSVVHPASRLP